MARTLLVDTNRAAKPIFDALCAQGHEVWVVGGRRDDYLATTTPRYVCLDYSDTAGLAEFATQKGFDLLIPGCNDLSYEVCARIGLGRYPGLDSPEATQSLNNKGLFRTIAREIGVPVPAVLTKEEAVGRQRVIVKPVDSFSGRGMTALTNASWDDITDAVRKAETVSSTGSAIIEELVAGQLLSHSAFVHDKRVAHDFVVIEHCVANSFTVDTSRVVHDFDKSVRSALRKDVSKLAERLKLVDGLVHTQFILDGARYWFIEVTRRCPGDLYSLLIEFSTGFPYASAYVAPFCGHNTAFSNMAATHRHHIIRHTISSAAGCSLAGYSFARPVSIRLLVPLAKAGEKLDPSPYGRGGILFLDAGCEARMNVLYRDLLHRQLYSFA
jgi:biotin carboxylase